MVRKASKISATNTTVQSVISFLTRWLDERSGALITCRDASHILWEP